MTDYFQRLEAWVAAEIAKNQLKEARHSERMRKANAHLRREVNPEHARQASVNSLKAWRDRAVPR